MPELPSVCIMIATYNQASYIGKAVASALAQDHGNLKVIVSDDASTDATEEILKHISDRRFTYFRNEQNIGRVANYRKLLYELADADWVLCLDGDDHLTDPSFISFAIAEIQNAGEKNVLFFQGAHLIGNGRTLKNSKTRIKERSKSILAFEFFSSYFDNRHFSHLATVYDRKAAIDGGFYSTDMISADVESFLRLCIKFHWKKVILSSRIAGVWVWHEHNLSQNADSKNRKFNNERIAAIADLAIEQGFDKKEAAAWKRKWKASVIRSYIKSLFN